MATPVFACGFECAVDTAHITATSGVPTFDTAIKHAGLRSYRCNAAGAAVYGSITFASVTRLVVRVYLYFTTIPATGFTLLETSVTRCGIAVGTTGEIGILIDNGSFGGSGYSLPVVVGQWYRVDLDINVSANPWTVDMLVDGATLLQRTAAKAASADTILRIGMPGAATGDVYYDDLLISNTGADYPIGPGKVLSFVPNADGTHTATTTTIVKGTIATPVGANVAGATDVFNWVNARPILGGATDATRLVNQQTAGTTLYAEEDFEATTEASPPRAVEVLTADRQASTASGGFSTKLNDNGTEDVIITRSAAGVITDRYVTKQYATMVGGGAWTLARFNALKARFGYSGDATPDQYWRGIMIEAEFAQVDLPNRPTIIRQAVMRATLR